MLAKIALRTLILSAALSASVRAADVPPDTLYVRCGKLMSSADAPLRGPLTMIVKGKTIAAIAESLPMPEGAHELDLSRYTVVPGFIDSHIHLWTGPYTPGTTPSFALQALRAQKALEHALQFGVVGVRVVGAFGFVDIALQKAVEEGTIRGPRMLAAGHPIMIPGGHGDYYDFPSTLPLRDFYIPLNGFVNSPADAEEAVHLQVKYGARTIKMFASGGVGSPLDSPDAQQLSPEEMRVVVQQAHMAQLKVAAHGESRRAILDALHAGIDSLEHASDLDKEAIQYMKKHRVWWVPTVHILDTIVSGAQSAPDYELRKGKALAAKHFASFKLGLQNGLAPQLVAGSDMKYEPGGGSLLDEMIALVKYGATPQQALAAGTKNGASLAGWDDMGTLEVGKEADFVALEGDPTRDITVIKKTKYVVFQGRVVVSPPERTE
jgi:imidazolonepropionase-like amidohydrolase